MSQIIRISFLLVLAYLISGCDDPVTYWRNRLEAKSGLDTAMRQVPENSEFAIITTATFEFQRQFENSGPTIYLARGYVILGSSLSSQEALNKYFVMVQAIGWIPRSDQYETSKVLKRGQNELMEIYGDRGRLGADLEGVVDYQKLKQMNRTLIFVLIDYVIPNAE